MKFTATAISALKPKSTRFEVWEAGRPGFGLRVAPSGKKSWIYLYRFEGKPRRMTLGRFPEQGLADAHMLHAAAVKKLEHGIDPGAEILAAKAGERNAETVTDLFDEYMKRHALPNKKSAADDQRIFDKDVAPQWGSRKAKSITRRDALTLLDGIIDRGAPVSANRALSLLHKVWNFGIERLIVDGSPFAGMRKPARETPRKRALDAQEIRTFWNKLPKASMTEAARLALKLLLVTAQRRGEVTGACWDEFDLETEGAELWTIPAGRVKNGQEHVVPLSPLAVSLLTEIKELSGDSVFLFPSPRDPEEPVVSGSISRALKRNMDVLSLPDFTPHDLRRTGRSQLSQMGISPIVCEKILNHALPGMIRVYDTFEYLPERRHALNAWAARITEIVSGTGAGTNVVSIDNAA